MPRLVRRSVFFLLLAAAPSVSAQSIDPHFDPLPTVPTAGTYSPEVQQAIEEGYRQLELVSSPEDDAHLDAAEAAFERALGAEPQAIHAWNGQGIYELRKDEQWLVVLESLKKILNRDHISMAVKAFERALSTDPEFHEARYNLALAHRQARGEENVRKAIEQLERLMREAPGVGETPILLAVSYRDVGELEQMIGALDSLPDGEALPAAARKLLLAFALVNTDQPAAGTTAYWEGVDAIATVRQADLFWHDIRPIASPDADARFSGLDVEGRKTMLRAFWQALADEGFVGVEDRLAEHYRRLHAAYRSYRLEIPERRHYSAVAAYVPPWQTGFDDRGIIYLRHGEPDDVATYSGPEVERNLSWKYDQADGDPLVFHFVNDEDVNDFKLVRRLSDAVLTNSSKLTGTTAFNPTCGSGGRCDSYDARILAGSRGALRDLYASRGHLSPYYDRASTSLDPQTLEREEINLAGDIAIGTRTQSFEPAQSGTPLLYPVHPVAFKNPGGESVVAFYYALPTTMVSVLPSETGGSRVEYRYQLLVNPPAGDGVAARQEDDVQLNSSSPIPQQAGVMLPAVRMVELDPGQYRYGMKVTDLTSGRFGVAQGTVEVSDFESGLAMSGVVLASRIEPGGSGAFVRWNRLKVLPLPSRMFLRSQPVYVYYEVYGLAAGSDGSARYRTTYTLESRQPDRNVVARFLSAVGELLARGDEEGAITYSFERSASESVDPLLEYFSLDVSESAPGEYLLTVAVEDVVSGGTTRRQVPLSITP